MATRLLNEHDVYFQRLKEEFDRIKKLGAEVISEPYKMGEGNFWIATLADPDGNYFQLMTPWDAK